jgi:hypothetical protein
VFPGHCMDSSRSIRTERRKCPAKNNSQICRALTDPFFPSRSGESGPICINEDEGYASARPCNLVYEVKTVPDLQAASGPESTISKFTKALANVCCLARYMCADDCLFSVIGSTRCLASLRVLMLASSQIPQQAQLFIYTCLSK